ncbi:MAG: acylphosphatase [Rhodobacteraceae bacterium]|nr:acylphosphatase [Paracoccaceae bacterium]
MSDVIKSIYVTIMGDLTDIGYCEFCVEGADKLGLTGWIRDRRDGVVEAIFHGRDDRLHKMIDMCSEGPEGTRIDRILATPCNPPNVAGFIRRPTY